MAIGDRQGQISGKTQEKIGGNVGKNLMGEIK
jgi:hypothetical protein